MNVFSFPNPVQRLFTQDTRPNHAGLCEVSPSTTAERHLIAFPGHKLGSVQFIVSHLCQYSDQLKYPLLFKDHPVD